MVEEPPDPDCLDQLVRRRNRLAYELVYAPESEQSTQQYLAKELRMNACTQQIDRLRRATHKK